MEDIQIVEYSDKWEEEHLRFARKYWKKKRRAIPEYIYWKFRGKADEQLPSLILAVKNNTVIGQIGLIPFDLTYKNKRIAAQWRCDLMVDKEYRGKNVAKKLYQVMEQNGRISLSVNPSPVLHCGAHSHFPNARVIPDCLP